MTEHVHSFYPVYTGITWELECLNCPARITLGTANARLNATERLSAEVARDMMADYTEGYLPYDILKDYINILEGKDG